MRHQHSEYPNPHRHRICLRGVMSGKPQVERTSSYMTEKKEQNSFCLAAGGEKEDHSLEQALLRAMSSHSRDISSPPLLPLHHLSAFV